MSFTRGTPGAPKLTGLYPGIIPTINNIASGSTTIGGHCDVDYRSLQLVAIVAKRYGSVQLNDLNRNCAGDPSATCDGTTIAVSPVHCEERLSPPQGIDFGNIGGLGSPSIGYSQALLTFLSTIVPAGSRAETNCESGSYANISRFAATGCNHQHIDFLNAGGAGLNIPASGSSSAITGSTIATVNMGGTWPQIYVNNGGSLNAAVGDSSGWHYIPLNISIATNATITAVSMGGTWPQIYVNNNGALTAVIGTPAGWTAQATGITGLAPGTSISAVNMGGTWPQIFINDNGALKAALGSTAGWSLVPLNVTALAGAQIAAVNTGQAWPQVFVNNGNYLAVATGTVSGWQFATTGVSGIGQTSPISAVYMGGTWPQVMINNGGTLYQVVGDQSGWHAFSTGVTTIGTGNGISAVNMGGTWPQVAVNTGAILTQVVAEATGWHALAIQP